MAADSLARFLDKLRTAVADETFVKLTLSNRRAPGALRNIYGRLVDLKAGRSMSFTLREPTRDITQNEPLEKAALCVERWLGSDFIEAHLFTTTADYRWKEGSPLKVAKPLNAKAAPLTHDRQKPRAVGNAPFLVKLGVTAADGTARAGMADKLRQIERFVELLGHLIADSPLRDAKSVRVFDMGAGRGYLTFAAYDFFRRRGVTADVTGVERREDLVTAANAAARELGSEGLRFIAGDIVGTALPDQLDILIALHACDTATDDALAAGVRAQAALIVAAPCCHKQIRHEFSPPPVLEGVLRHGILAERQAELLTDGLRALALQARGYDARVFEFISSEHTAKNLMLAAARTTRGDASEAAEKMRAAMEFFGIREQRLAALLGL